MHFSKNMDKVFPTMGFVCLPLIRFKSPPLSGFLLHLLLNTAISSSG
ncbi:hypothetical protein HIE11_004351 [Escherichia coli]|nr:hypothetical protein [Escherichia coli]EFI3396155.1 hypothetical protein [Escherichia coli]EFI3479246.1 hypothetical protein [Escherichia coli]EFI8348334.1 hypothetical protein [Escherichia coli]EFI8861105.1 hypothetical protein [Escherichia coli]